MMILNLCRISRGKLFGFILPGTTRAYSSFTFSRYQLSGTNRTQRSDFCRNLLRSTYTGCGKLEYKYGFLVAGYGARFMSTDTTTTGVKSSILTDAKDTEEEEKAKRAKSWQKMKLSLTIMGAVFGITACYSFYTLGSPARDEEGQLVPDEFNNLPTLQQYCKRFIHNVKYYTKVIKEPSQQKLLPDPLQYPYIQPPYTLVLELTDLLVHPDWTYKTGWRFKKRPNIDMFLEQVSPPLFEVVVFTAEQGITVFPILNQLDKNGVIVYRLVRDSTDFVDGHHVKNLDWLNRDLSKVIVVDWNADSVKLHPSNALVIPRWSGNDDDDTLIDLAAFLKAIAYNRVDDVREVLQYYRGFDDPIEAFRENQRKLQEQMEEQERMMQDKKEHPPLASRYAKTYVSRK